jgi:hypothetical protein
VPLPVGKGPRLFVFLTLLAMATLLTRLKT